MKAYRLLLLVVIALTACDAAPGANALPAGPLDGIYLGLRENFATGQIYQDYFTFFPDGRVIDDAPSEGLDRPFDWAQACAQFPCGTYTRQGDEVRIRWGSADADKVYDLDDEGTLRERGKTQGYRPLRPLDGLRLDGTYAQIDDINDLTLVTITFTPDGRFTEHNLMTHTSWVLLGDDPAEREQMAVPGGSGTYSVRRNTLELRYDGGPTAYFSLIVPPGEQDRPVPGTIYVNLARIPRVP